MLPVLRSFPLLRRALDAATTAWLRDVIRSLRDPYRPERHYMRGPGPKWHAKRAMSSARPLPVAT